MKSHFIQAKPQKVKYLGIEASEPKSVNGKTRGVWMCGNLLCFGKTKESLVVRSVGSYGEKNILELY